MKFLQLAIASILIISCLLVIGCGGGDGGIGPEGVTPEIERQDQEAMDRIGEQEAEGMQGLKEVVDEDPPPCVE